MKRKFVASIATLFVCATSAQGSAIMEFQQVGSSVVGILSGSLNLTGMTSICCAAAAVAINGSHAHVGFGIVGASERRFDQAFGPASFGTGNDMFPSRSLSDFQIQKH